MNFISSYCHISADLVRINNTVVIAAGVQGTNDMTRDSYMKLGLDYPKFYKMDALSKIGFLGTEFLLKQNPELANYGSDEIALVFSNRNSSAETDLKFEASCLEGNSPSPSLFVYTLPNIFLGELAIRNKWHGENLFVIAPEFDAAFYAAYCNELLHHKVKACCCGWVDVFEDKTEGFVFFVEKQDVQKLNLPFTADELNRIYKIENYEQSKGRLKETHH